MKTKKKKKERSLHSESASDFQFLLQNFGILLKKGLQSTKGDILCNFIIRIYSKTLFPDNVKKIPEFFRRVWQLQVRSCFKLMLRIYL